MLPLGYGLCLLVEVMFQEVPGVGSGIASLSHLLLLLYLKVANHEWITKLNFVVSSIYFDLLLAHQMTNLVQFHPHSCTSMLTPWMHQRSSTTPNHPICHSCMAYSGTNLGLEFESNPKCHLGIIERQHSCLVSWTTPAPTLEYILLLLGRVGA